MKIFLHGLGQTPSVWDRTLAGLELEEPCLCPDLAGLLRGKETSYAELYAAFSALCEPLEDPLELCGLSLGAVLALQYAAEHPQRLRSLVLIAPQVKMPKLLLRIQNTVFRLMPGAAFQQMGFGKAAFMQLCRSMMPLDFTRSLEQISCPTLVLCGEKDAVNRKSAIQTAKAIQGARFQTVAGAGHECNAEAPEKLAALLRQFWPE